MCRFDESYGESTVHHSVCESSNSSHLVEELLDDVALFLGCAIVRVLMLDGMVTLFELMADSTAVEGLVGDQTRRMSVGSCL